jgi:hypothetical protein
MRMRLRLRLRSSLGQRLRLRNPESDLNTDLNVFERRIRIWIRTFSNVGSATLGKVER